ncbi:MAG: hypothetical protein JWM75_2673 [Sphingomonas bacterium]|nr:hypothetical protein [Sphingomonas bacterium]
MRPFLTGLALALLAMPAIAPASPATELRALRDREEIRQLLIDYGATIDARDFAAFGRLFARDAEYASGPGAASKGPKAIATSLEAVFASNPSGVRDPNFHLLTNPQISLAGDTATARSMGLFVAPGTDGRLQILIAARYADELVREGGRWRFRKRTVQGLGTKR